MTQQIEHSDDLRSRRVELANQIACGEDSLLASADDQTRRALDIKISAIRYELQQLDSRLAADTKESFPKFCERHGGEYVQCDGLFLFPDGATVDPRGMFYFEPILDSYSKLKAAHRYIEAKLNAEINAFKNFKAECTQMAIWAKLDPSVCCPPPPDAAEKLRRGQLKITALREELATITMQLSESPEEVTKRKRQESERERQQGIQERLQAINAVSIDG